MDKVSEDKKEMAKGENPFGGQKDGAKKDGPDDDEMKRDKMDKSVGSDALDATIDLLETTLQKSETHRTQELMAIGAKQGLNAEQSEELRKALAGDLGGPRAADQVSAAMTGDEDLVKSVQLDVSGYLAGLQGGITESLEHVANRLEKGFKDQEDNSYVLAKALLDVCKVQKTQATLVKGMQDQLEGFGRQPAAAARAARSPAQAEALKKGFGPSGANAPVPMSKGQILETLGAMSLSKAYEPMAQDLGLSIARYESTNEISPALLERVIAFRQGN